MLRRSPAAGLLLAGVLLSSFSAAALAQSPAPGLEGIDWRLTQIAGSGVPVIDVPADVDATLRIDGTQANGNGGCNAWFATVKVDGDAIVFDQVGSTMMACEEPRMGFETQYLGYLDDVQSWAIAGDTLQLADGNGVVLLSFASQAGAAALEGTDWRADQVWMDGAMAGIANGIDVTLRMDGGQANGIAGCNSYFGGYTLDGAALTFGPLGATEMACPEPRMTIESAWLTALGSVTGWSIIDGSLHLVDAAGNDLAILSPAATASIEGTWQLAELAMGDAIALVDSDATLTFGADGSLTGSTGCNNLTSEYAVDSTAIKVGPVATTKMACKDDGLQATESALLSALERAATWSISPEGWLVLQDASGALLAGFTPGTVA